MPDVEFMSADDAHSAEVQIDDEASADRNHVAQNRVVAVPDVPAVFVRFYEDVNQSRNDPDQPANVIQGDNSWQDTNAQACIFFSLEKKFFDGAVLAKEREDEEQEKCPRNGHIQDAGTNIHL